MKKMLAMVLIFTFTLSLLVCSASAEKTEHELLLHQLIDRQLQSIVLGEVVPVSDITVNNENMIEYNRFMDWRVSMATLLGTCYRDYKFEITDFVLQENGLSAEATLDVNVDYANGAGLGGYWNCPVSVNYEETDSGIKISSFNSQEEIMNDYLELFNEKKISRSIADDKIQEELISNLYRIASEFESVSNLSQSEFNELQQLSQEIHKESPDTLATGNCYYNANDGVAYAKKYVNSQNSKFYRASPDCTNFISQCIWAAYGGWSNGNESIMQNLIANRTYMMSSSSINNWFAHEYGGGFPWENVEGLWDFATRNPSIGPKATGYNDNGYYSDISFLAINIGDALQFRRGGGTGDFDHSGYVVTATHSMSDNYSGVLMAMHSSNGIYSVAEKVASMSYMRQMVFKTAKLNT